MDPKWFLVKTKALNEPRVHKRLTGAGYEVLFPKISRKSKRHRGLFEMRPLFPTYLDAIFVEEMPDRERVVLLLDAVSSYKLTIEKDSLER
ncbi:MAG TPA: transcription termination/antitermination NusG family protein [Candidatus Deferrimicrobium sp.]